MTERSVAVIGGGAAGMMAAATLAEAWPGLPVTLYERNRGLGAKVIISGGGRCNVTTGMSDVTAVLTRYPRGGRWLRHALHSFPPVAVTAWFEAHGVPLKTERDLRVFPISDDGHDVVAAFERVFARSTVNVRLGERVVALTHDRERGGFVVMTERTRSTSGAPGGAGRSAGDTRDGGGRFAAVIITTGGAAFRQTGSSGDGYRFAESLDQRVTPLSPSLNAYVVRERWAHALAGLSIADAGLRLSAPDGSVTPYRFRGPFVFTHVGVSGPAVFALCSLAARETASNAAPLPLHINLLPALNEAEVDALVRERCAALGGRGIANVLDTLLPRSICAPLCALAGVDPALPAARLARAERGRLVTLIRALPLSVVGRKNGEEFVTAGGVALEQIDPRTMAARGVPGLFFAGEVLDVDGFTGGYNLQAAWATGRLAAHAAGAFLSKTDG